MRCENCGQDNRAGAAFCLACGSRVPVRCHACARDLQPGANFCDACGTPVPAATAGPTTPPAYAPPPHLAERILRDRAQLEGERRTVSVLFIDAVSSTARSERVDPELLHRVVQRCTAQMIDAVNHFEGTVTQFRGDGIMAIFGAPIAHEDSARRAVSAALMMRDDLQAAALQLAAEGNPHFAYRIGIHTGSVVVGVIGNDLTMDYTAIGDTVNLAARMEQWASPDSVYITDSTRRAADGYFELRDLGLLEVKGKSEGVHVYEAVRDLGARSRLDASAERGLTPYVGRDLQLSLLRGYFEHAREGHGQVALISGEAGMGKSRLLLEFRRSLADRATWLEGRCISWGRNFPYLPVIDIVRRAIGVEDGDDDAALTARIAAATARWGDDPGHAAAPHLRYLLNAASGTSPVDPADRHAGILEALRALVIHESARAPLVILCEDVHWADELSEEAFAALVDAVAQAPILLVLTYRPGYMPPIGERTYFNRIALRNLPPQASASMVASVLDSDGVPPALQAMIVVKAEGNPFYIEEVTRSLLDSGTLRRDAGGFTLARPLDQVRIPDTIQEVILSRLDRLAPAAKDAVQRASVIGREFPLRLLQRVIGAGDAAALMRDLTAMELVYEKTRGPEPSYIFKHALTQDVALSTLLQERRAALHRSVAEAIEEVYADRPGDHDEALAQHYYEGRDWQNAAEYALRVAGRAQSLHAPRAVAEHVTRAIDASAMLDMPVDAALYRMRAQAYELVGEFEPARGDYETSIQLAHDAADRTGEWHATAALGMLWAGRDYARTGEYFERAHDIAREIGDRRTLARSLNRLANWHLNSERPAEAMRGHEEALDIFHELEDRRGLAETLDFLTMATAFTGDIRHAADYGNRAIALYRELDDKHALATMLPSAGFCGPNAEISTCVMPPPEAMSGDAYCAEAIALSQEIGFRSGEAYARMNQSMNFGATGRLEEALQSARAGLEIATDIGHRQWQAGCMTVLAMVLSDMQDDEGALELLERAMPLARELGSPHWFRQAASFAITLLQRAGETERVARLLEDAGGEALAMDTLSKRSIWLARIDLALMSGQPAAALTIIEALERTAPGFVPAIAADQIPNLAWRRGQALLLAGDATAAEPQLRAALRSATLHSMLPMRWGILAHLARALAAQDRPAEAATCREEAATIIESMAAPLSDAAVRDAFRTRALTRLAAP